MKAGMKDRTLLPDTLLSIAVTIVLLCVLRDTVVVVFSLWSIIGFVVLWHLALAAVDRLRPSPVVMGTILFILAVIAVLYAARVGSEGSEGWLSGYFRWATAESGHNAETYLQYRMATLGTVSLVFALAMFLLVRCEAHVGLLIMVGVSIFMGMQWAGFSYAPILLWLFLFLILIAALRQGLWKEGQQGIQMLYVAPLCALMLLAVSALPLEGEALGQKIIDRFSLFSGGAESPIDWGPFAFFKVGQGGDATDIGRDLGGPFEPDNRTLLYLTADKPLYMKARTARTYNGRRWETPESRQYAFQDTLFLSSYPHYSSTFTQAIGAANDSPEYRIQEERYQMPSMLRRFRDGGQENRRWYDLKRATVYYWDMNTNSVFTPDGFLRFRRTRDEERENPFSITREQTITSSETMEHDDAYSLYYLDYNLTAEEWDALLNESRPGITREMADMFGMVPSDIQSSLKFDEEARKQYLDLPASLPERVYALAREITSDAITTHQKAKAIEQYLSTTFPYAINVPETPQGVDFVDYFLFDLQKGYCTYYATAMVVLCRALDIPARYTEGFAFAQEPFEGYYYATGAQAHAWPEVYLDGFGWVSYEPTAGFGGAFADAYRNGEPAYRSSEPPSYAPAEPTPTASPDETPETTAPPIETPEPTAGERFADAMGAVGGFLLRWGWIPAIVLWVAFNHLRHRRFRYWMRRSTYGKAGIRRIYRRGVRMLAIIRLAPQPSETPKEMALRVGREIRDGGVLMSLAEAYSHAIYGEQFPNAEERKAAAVALDCIETAVRLHWQDRMRLWLLRYGLGIV